MAHPDYCSLDMSMGFWLLELILDVPRDSEQLPALYVGDRLTIYHRAGCRSEAAPIQVPFPLRLVITFSAIVYCNNISV